MARFSIQDSLKKVRFFEGTFLLANTSIEMVLGIPFFSLNNANVGFSELKKLTWKIYTTTKALPTSNRVKLINKKKFAKAARYENFETFVIHIAALEMPTIMPIYSLKIS